MINWFWFDHITLKSNHQIFEEVYTYNTSWVYIFNTWEFPKSDRKKARQTWYVTSGEKRKQKCQNELFSSYKLKQEKPVASSLCEKTAGRSGDIKIPNGYFGQKLQAENRKSGHHHWILHIWISLSAKFQLKLTILIFRTKITQKRVFPLKNRKS